MISRRNMLQKTGLLTVMPLMGLSSSFSEDKNDNEKKVKVIVIGAHPDDPETGCGGAISLFAKNGCDVVSAYLTRGEAGIPGTPYNKAAEIRTNEALKACKVMNARAVFLGQIDGNCEITHNRYQEIYDFIKAEAPDIVFTHWPVDTHRDHRICSSLVFDSWLQLEQKYELYYFEVESGSQTQNFNPTEFVDISSVIKQKHEACSCHVSQQIETVMKEYHEPMEKFRGMQANCAFAEAFIRQGRRLNIGNMLNK
jgi:LmbE family N-acetylglucosaminyl deacetylase